MEIPKNILEKTTKCKSDFDCLKNPDHPCLNIKVDSFTDNGVMLMECDNESCNYHICFGDNKKICSCPTRIHIYKQYGK